jgi:hypothetical protein
MAKKNIDKKAEPVRKKIGRPSMYTPELAAKICRAISSSTDSLSKICFNNKEFPMRETIWEWRIDYPEFANMYNDAKRAQADLLAEDILAISDDSLHDIMINELTGRETMNSEYVARSRLRVETRKWIACKLLPKVYGDKTTTESTITIKHEELLKELE